jgi:hypothetical protein
MQVHLVGAITLANPFFEPLPENGVPEFEQILSHHYEEAEGEGQPIGDR